MVSSTPPEEKKEGAQSAPPRRRRRWRRGAWGGLGLYHGAMSRRAPVTLWVYVAAELWRLLLLTVAVLVTVIAFAAAVKPLADGKLGPAEAIKFMVLAIPPMLAYALPFAAGFAATLAYHRMAQDNELLAAHSGGIAHRSLLTPAVGTGFALFLALASLNEYAIPHFLRAMERLGPPLRIIAPGRVFRYETEDASHANTFHQLEGLLIDRNISIANLIAVMKLILSEVFHRDVKVRLRPGYFPFVEPGFELDMECGICGGSGCPTCKRSGWVEILPCGMVHPNVLRFGGIDPREYTGFAFGMGLTRLAMMKYGVRDIRGLNSGDLRAIVRPEKRSGAAIVEKD